MILIVLFINQGKGADSVQEEGHTAVHRRLQAGTRGVEGPGEGEDGGRKPQNSTLLQTPGGERECSNGKQETKGGSHGPSSTCCE